MLLEDGHLDFVAAIRCPNRSSATVVSKVHDGFSLCLGYRHQPLHSKRVARTKLIMLSYLTGIK